MRKDLFALFSEANPYARAKRLESVLNRLVAPDGIGVREAFHVIGDESEGIVEQIDGQSSWTVSRVDLIVAGTPNSPSG